MNTFKAIRWTAISVICLLLTGCYSTYLTSTWRACDAPPADYDKIGVVALIPTTTHRGIVEDALVREFYRYRINAVATVNFLPQSSIPNMYTTGDTAVLQGSFREKISNEGIDAVMIISILDSEKEEHYTGGRTLHYVEPVYGGWGVPYAYPLSEHIYIMFPHYRYYTRRHVTVYQPGYYFETTNYFVETSLFDTSTEQLIWSAQTTTVDPGDVRSEAAIFAQVIVEGMLRDRVLKFR